MIIVMIRRRDSAHTPLRAHSASPGRHTLRFGMAAGSRQAPRSGLAQCQISDYRQQSKYIPPACHHRHIYTHWRYMTALDGNSEGNPFVRQRSLGAGLGVQASVCANPANANLEG